MAIDANKIYRMYKGGQAVYVEEVHCPMVLEVMDTEGTMSAFCVKAGISDTTFYRWLNAHPLFQECYRLGCMIARENWEEDGRQGRYEEDFNLEIWKVQGSARFGVGRSNRVRIHLDADSTPFDQYKQLVNQATMGDFSAAEFKQLMESINIGCRAYESFELQQQVDQMKEDLQKMKEHDGHNIIPIKEASKRN